MNCCNTPRFRKFGTTKTFLTVLIFVAIVQGVSEKFVFISAEQAAFEHDYDENVIGKMECGVCFNFLCVIHYFASNIVVPYF